MLMSDLTYVQLWSEFMVFMHDFPERSRVFTFIWVEFMANVS